MGEQRKYALLFAATLLAARKLHELGDKTLPDPTHILRPEQLGERLKVPVSWVYENTRRRAGRRGVDPLPCMRMGKYLRFYWPEVEKWPERRQGGNGNGRHQKGYIWRKGNSWFGRWREDVLEDGRVVHRQRSAKLADVCDWYRSKADVRPLLAEKLRPLNEGRRRPESTLPVATFVESCYLPSAQENCRPSTYSAYKTQWERYLAPRLRKTILRDFRTVDAANLLADIHRAHGIGRSTLRHLKAFMSATFTLAKNQGVIDGPNPIQGPMIPRKAAAPGETYASTPDEVLAMMEVLKKAGEHKACCAIALVFFGLRPGEARGARWEDFDGKQLIVHQSIWRTHATEPKTDESSKPVPIIEPLRSLLVELQVADGNPAKGPILGPLGNPMIISPNEQFDRYSRQPA